MSTKQKNDNKKVQKKSVQTEETGTLLQVFWRKYSQITPLRLKLIDSFILYLTTLIVWQVFYRYVVGTDFPKNAYLSGILGPLGVIVMTVSLRLQIGRESPNKVSVQRALWQFLAGVLVLFVVIVNFLG